MNEGAIHLLEKNFEESKLNGTQSKINWMYLSGNPSIFEIDEKLYRHYLNMSA